MNARRILVVDDEAQIRKFLRIALEAHGIGVSEAATGADAIAKCAIEQPDLVILDLGLPDEDGKTVVGRIREWSAVPILVLSVRQAENEKVAALDAGAMITSSSRSACRTSRACPGAPANRRRSCRTAEATVGDLTVDFARHEVRLAGETIKLTRREFDAGHARPPRRPHRHPWPAAPRNLG